MLLDKKRKKIEKDESGHGKYAFGQLYLHVIF